MKNLKMHRQVSIRGGWRSLMFAATAVAGVAAPLAAKAEVTLYNGNGPIPSIQVYLRLDAGLRLVTNVDNEQYNGTKGTSTLVQGGGNDWGTSMFGVEGTAKIAPGLTGVYKVESGFDATTGTFNSATNSIFNRRAYVGLSSPIYGTILLGKDLFIDNDIWNFDPMGQENFSTSTLVNGRNWDGASNMVEYRSPSIYGFEVGAQASFNNGDGAQSTRLSNMYGVSAEYDISKLSLYGIYDEIQDEHGNFTNLFAASKEAIIGATLNLTSVEFYVGAENLSAPSGGASNPEATPIFGTAGTSSAVFATNQNMTWIGAAIQAAPALVFRTA
jgi:predicted porin